MKYDIFYQETHDIDWFLKCNGKFYHIASNGGMIPDVVDRKNNQMIQHMVAISEEKTNDIEMIDDEDYKDSSFEEFAHKGFITIDRCYGDFDEQNYRIIAYPKDNSEPDNNIKSLIPEADMESLGMIIVNKSFMR